MDETKKQDDVPGDMDLALCRQADSMLKLTMMTLGLHPREMLAVVTHLLVEVGVAYDIAQPGVGTRDMLVKGIDACYDKVVERFNTPEYKQAFAEAKLKAEAKGDKAMEALAAAMPKGMAH